MEQASIVSDQLQLEPTVRDLLAGQHRDPSGPWTTWKPGRSVAFHHLCHRSDQESIQGRFQAMVGRPRVAVVSSSSPPYTTPERAATLDHQRSTAVRIAGT